MSGSKGYKITVEGQGLSLDREVSKEIGEKVVVLLLTGASLPAGDARASVSNDPTADAQPGVQPHPLASGQGQAPNQPNAGNLSIREFLDSCMAKRAPDKIVTIGVYLRNQGKHEFDRSDIVASLEHAAEQVPKNLSRDLKWTQKAGWIAPKTGTKDKYYVTNTGNTALLQKFSREVVQKTRGFTTAKRTSSKKDVEAEA